MGQCYVALKELNRRGHLASGSHSRTGSWAFVTGAGKFVKLDWKEIVWRNVSGWESHTSGGLSD